MLSRRQPGAARPHPAAGLPRHRARCGRRGRRRRRRLCLRASRPAPAVQARQAALLTADADGPLPAVPLHGRHQPGIAALPQRASVVLSFNVTAENRPELTDLLRTLTDRARFLTAGGIPPPVGISAAAVRLRRARPGRGAGRADRHASAWARRCSTTGSAWRQPSQPVSTPMLPFPDDNLDPAQTGGDLSLDPGRRAPGHRAARAAGHRQAHPRRDAGAVADRRFRQPRPARRHDAAQPAGLHGRHRQPAHRPTPSR